MVAVITTTETSPPKLLHPYGVIIIGHHCSPASVPRQDFNRCMRQVLAMIELGSGCRHSLGFKLRGLGHLVVKDTKMALIEAAKEKTQVMMRCRI
jgi:hypothetical protein